MNNSINQKSLMINLQDIQPSERMLVVKQALPVVIPVEIQLEMVKGEESEEINPQNIKQVDSSSGHQEQDELHLGILDQDWMGTRENQIRQREELEAEQQIQNAQISMIVLGEAVAERKSLNLKGITEFMQAHIKYYSRHMDVLIDLETQIVSRLSKEREFVQEVYQHFYSLHQPQPLTTSISSSHIFLEQEKKTTYEKIVDALKNIMIARNQFQRNVGTSSCWVSGEALVYLNQLIMIHENNLSHYSQEILRYKLLADQRLKLLNVLFKEIQKMIVFGTGGKEVDLLSEEVKYFSVANEARDIMEQWGAVVNTLWLTSQKGEISIVSEIKKYIDALHENIGALMENNEKVLKAQEYWLGFNAEQEVKAHYHISFIVNDQNHTMIRKSLGKGNLKNQDFQRFIRLQHERYSIGNPQEIQSVLTLKKFTCKLVLSKTKTENVLVYSSVDGFIVFVSESSKKLLNSMNFKSTMSIRLSHQVIEVKEKQPGFFRNSWNKAELQFGSSNQTQQFLIFLAQSMQEIEGIIQ